MKSAIALAEKGRGFTNPNPLVGAVIVKNGKIIAEGWHHKLGSLHAERDALKNAAEKNVDVRGASIYVTLEPCPMCCGAIINSRIDDVIFGAYDIKSGSAVSVQKIFELPYNYRPEVFGGVMQKECADVLSLFFKKLREKKKIQKNFQKTLDKSV